MSIGTGLRMISWKNGSLSRILLSHSEGKSGLRSIPQTRPLYYFRKVALLLGPFRSLHVLEESGQGPQVRCVAMDNREES